MAAVGGLENQWAVLRAQVIGMGLIPQHAWDTADLEKRKTLVDDAATWLASSLSKTWPTSLQLACGHVVNWPLQSGDTVHCRACRG